ncbi:MAG: OsmC family peroxiredoxin [Cytophagales bacterium]|nr:MAG: OsmC family peroxiredoxin [Cytophagales bacterium]
MQNQVSSKTLKTNYQVSIKTNTQQIIADEPEDLGGSDEGMQPNELLLASLAACTSITLQMYAQRKNWQLEEVQMQLNIDKHPTETGSIIERHITLIGDLSEEQKQRLLQIANACPVHKILKNPIEIQTTIQ